MQYAVSEDTAALNIKPATVRPRATEHIAEIIDFVADLIDKGYNDIVNKKTGLACGDPKGNRTPDSAVRGLRLNRLTIGPF